MVRRVSWGVLLVVASSCLDLALPAAPPPPGPGTISGRAVVAVAGRAERRPAAGAFVRLLPSGLTTRTSESGVFVLEGVTRSTGELLVQHDGDGDGRFERQRLVRLDDLHPGLGRQVQVGDVVVEENASVAGRVLRAEVMTPSGHVGSTVFVPEGPFTATTADDGRFLLENLPAGTLRLAFFRAGYESRGFDSVTLRPGEELTLADVSLVPASRSSPGALEGTLVTTPATMPGGARVELTGADGLVRLTSPSADGAFSFAQLPPDLYRLEVTLAGYQPALLQNVIVQPGETTRVGTIDLHGGVAIVFPDAGPGARDAGVRDAGATADGGADGGAPDGGRAPDAGFTSDAGVDAGSVLLPNAVVAPTLAVRPGQVNVVLDGSGSSDPLGRALVFHWAQVSGPRVTLSVNDTTQATTRFDAPTMPGVLRFDLTVTNAAGLTSAPATVLVTVQAPPVAAITPGSFSLRTGLVATLDGRLSNDPAGGPLSYEWAVTAGTLTLEGITDAGVRGDRVQVRAGATTGAGEVRLVVTNTLGLVSAPATVTVSVTNDPVVVQVDAGSAQVVGLGQLVVLRASATSTDPSDSFTFSWAPLLADGGVSVDAGVSLTSTVGSVTSFMAPVTPQALGFSVTATGTSSGASSVGKTQVLVQDDRAPQVVTSDPPIVGAGRPDGPWWELSVTFDEPIEPTSVTPTSIVVLERDAGVPVDIVWDAAATTVRVTPRHPLSLGADADLVLTGLSDTSSLRNVMAPTRLPFRVRSPLFKTYVGASGTSANPLPVPLITGRDVGFVGFYRPTSGCGGNPSGNFFTLGATGFTGPAVEASQCGCGRSEQRAHAVALGRAYYACGRDFVFTNVGASFVTQGTLGAHALNTDGVTVGGTAGGAGNVLNWYALTSTGWGVAESVHSQPVYDNGVAEGFGGAVAPNRSLALGISSVGLRIAERVGASIFFVELPEASPVTQPVMPRGAYVGTRPAFCVSHVSAGQLLLRCALRNTQDTGWLTFTDVGQGPIERVFDVQSWGDTLFLAYAQAGVVKVSTLDASSSAPTFVPLLGPAGVTAWNQSPACTARAPAMQVRADGVWVAFQESCGGAWSVVLRKAF